MKQSYDVTIECQVMGAGQAPSVNSLDLKNPYFRYTGVQPQAPPGEAHVSPSEAYWSQVDMQGARQVSEDDFLTILLQEKVMTEGPQVLHRRES